MSKSPIKAEQKKIKEKLRNLLDCTLNYFFKLDRQGTQKRNYLRLILSLIFVILWLYISIKILLGDISLQEFDAPSLLLIIFRLIFILVIPYQLAMKAASEYLANIFELKDTEVSRKFIYQAAFGGKYGKITIKNGEIVEKDSPIIQIGGPGEVKVDLHSAALFEKADGRTRIIGPLTENKKKKNTLDGFERLRKTIDLRDVIAGPQKVSQRTKDGLLVSVEDLRMSFSINRGSQETYKKLTTLKAYPFQEKAFLNLIYQETNDISAPKRIEAPQIFQTKIKGGQFVDELKSFIRKHSLSDFISSEGAPEKEAYQAREENFENIKRETLSEPQKSQKAPAQKQDRDAENKHQTRDKISKLFSKFSYEQQETNNSGNITLNWIGIGTWRTPENIVPEQHLEAWRISRENAKEGSDKNLEKSENEAKLKEFMRLVKMVPLHSARIQGVPYPYYAHIRRQLLIDYLALLKAAGYLIPKYVDKDEQQNVAKIFIQAIKTIQNSLKGHWV